MHLHTEYSLLDGACRVSEIPKAVKGLNQRAVAITDHENMYGAVNFYLECIKADIKPIIGCEINVTEPEYEGHLTLLAENNTGYKNLMCIASAAYIDFKSLKAHCGGLIALSGCTSGFLFKSLANSNIDSAADYIQRLIDIFGRENFFMEIQDCGINGQYGVNKKLFKLAKIYSIEIAATNNVHYIRKEDAEVRQILSCIRENKIIGESGNGITIETEKDIDARNYMQNGECELYLKSAEQMSALFENELPAVKTSAIENTVRIADRCNVTLDFSTTHLPKYELPKGFAGSEAEYLRELSKSGLSSYIRMQTENNTPVDADLYEERLEYELEIIESMGYADYYLIVWDFINYSKSNNISVGPGRGSGAGSLAAFCTGITDIDPIKYGLFFERFLNPERVSMPDFDIDLCHERRREVIEYVIDKYRDRAAHIITFGTMAARGAVRDVGRVTGVNLADVDYIAKLIPQELGMTLDKALETSEELRKFYDNADYAKNLIDTAKKLEGLPRHTSVHAAGIVITDKQICEYLPIVAGSADTDAVITQYDMDAISQLGLLKIDFLGSRYLTIIENAVQEIRKNRPHKSFGAGIDINKINLDDESVYKLYASGHTDGVFQFESSGMKNLLTSLKPESFDDIIAAIALFRPGPMDAIPAYIKSRHSGGEIKYKLPQLRPILETTYGCIVYQEQVMQIFRTLAGYSYGRADIVRRAMSKKQAGVMEKEMEYFLAGCIENNIDGGAAAEIFDEMAEFANYAFNKSHAAAYALVSYRTAYLKRYYPREFFAALLSSSLNINDSKKIQDYIRDCRRWNIEIYPPDINLSGAKFSADGKGIRYGLLAIKNTGFDFTENIVAERETGGRYVSFANFLDRMAKRCKRSGFANFEISKKQVEALIGSGVFDKIENRENLVKSYESMIDEANGNKRYNISGQMNLFETERDSSNSGIEGIGNKLIQNNQNDDYGDYIDNKKKQVKKEVEILYIKVEDTESRIYKKVLSLIGIFEGRAAVRIYEEKTGKVFARVDMGVELSAVFVNELKELLGEGNVKIVKK